MQVGKAKKDNGFPSAPQFADVAGTAEFRADPLNSGRADTPLACGYTVYFGGACVSRRRVSSRPNAAITSKIGGETVE
jgi:hypothetical protein